MNLFSLGITIWWLICAFGNSEGQLDKNHFEFVNSLNCTVKDEREGVVSDSPSYCWVFSKDTSGRRYAPKNEINCCWIVQQSNDRIGGDLSAIVEVHEDGIHIFYNRFTRSSHKHEGLLIPMLSRWKDQIEFRVNPISCSTGGADLWNHLRVAANTFYFSYTTKGLELNGKIGDRSKENADPLYNSTYARQCNICEERIYFSHQTSVDDYLHRRDPIFRIGKSKDYGDKFAWIEHSGYFNVEVEHHEQHANRKDIADWYRKFQRINDPAGDPLCPVDLRLLHGPRIDGKEPF